MAACIRSVMNSSVSNTMIIEFSKLNEWYRHWLDLLLLVYVCCTTVLAKHRCILMDYFNICYFSKNELMRSVMMVLL